VKAAAEEAVKDQTTQEKQAIGLEERRKHANSKAKKLKKTVQEVRSIPFSFFRSDVD
jgi:structural maintenance of chromosome 4